MNPHEILSLLITACGANVVIMIGNIVMWWLQRKAAREDRENIDVVSKVKELESRQTLQEDGIIAMLHDRLYQSCRYFLRKGSVTSAALKNLEYLYNAYHNLGGNGTGTELYHRVCALPIVEQEDIT